MLVESGIQQQFIECDLLGADEIQMQVEKLASELSVVTASALNQGLSESLREKVEEHLGNVSYCVLVKDGEKVIGFGFYALVPTDHGLVLYEDTKMVGFEDQGRGVGVGISELARERIGEECILAMMRIQNPAEVISFEKAFPSSKAYQPGNEVDRKVLQAVGEHFGVSEEIDFDRGTFYYSKPEENMGNYEIRDGDRRVVEIEQIFLERRLNRMFGGMLYFIAELNEGVGES